MRNMELRESTGMRDVGYEDWGMASQALMGHDAPGDGTPCGRQKGHDAVC